MELIILLVVGALLAAPVALIIALVNAARSRQLSADVDEIRRQLRNLQRTMDERARLPQPSERPRLATDTVAKAVAATVVEAAAPAAQPEPLAGEGQGRAAMARQGQGAEARIIVSPAPPSPAPGDADPRGPEASPPSPEPQWPPELGDSPELPKAPEPADPLESPEPPQPSAIPAAVEAPIAATSPEPAPASVAPARPFPPQDREQGDGLDGLEELLGRRLLTWLGIAILFLAAAFVVHLAHEHGYLGRIFTPWVRLLGLLAAAAAGYAWGWRCHQRGHLPLGQGLLGGSIGLTVLAIFAAYRPGLLFAAEATPLGPVTAFMALAATSGWGFVLAVRLNALVLAHMALLCGLATPLLLSTGQGERDVLCAWLLILNTGALAAAAGRNWRGLPTVAVSGSALLLAAWVFGYGIHRPSPDWIALAWFAAFQALALALPVVGSRLRQRAPELGHLLLSASASTVLLSLAWALLQGERTPLALLSGVFALLQALQVGLFLRPWASARRIGTASVLLQANLALALVLGAHSLSVVWSAKALILFAAGLHGDSLLLRRAALLLLVLATACGLGHALNSAVPSGSFPGAGGWWLSLGLLPVAWGLWALIQGRGPAGDASDQRIAQVLALACGLGLVAAAGAETMRLRLLADPAWWASWPPSLALAWTLLIGSAGLAGWARWRSSPAGSWQQGHNALIALGLAQFLILVSYGHGQILGPLLLLNPQGLAVLVSVVLALALYRLLAEPRVLLVVPLALAVGLACELWVWAGHWGLSAADRLWWLALWWGLLGLVGRDLAYRKAWPGLVHTAILLLTLGAALWLAWAIGSHPPADPQLLAGWWWLGLALPAALAMALTASAARHNRPQAAAWRRGCAPIIGLGLTLVAAAELLRLQNLAAAAWWPELQPGLLAWLITLSAAAHVGWERWRQPTALATPRGLGPDLGSVGLALAALASVLLLVAYGRGVPSAPLPLLNLHGLLSLLAPALLALGWTQRALPPLGWLAFGSAFVLTTCEAWAWPAGQGMDGRSSLLAITAAWTLWASALLTFGLRGDRRLLRLVGLGIMGLAVAKLLVVDLSGMGANQRIIITLVVGVACLAAGAGYHRLARRHGSISSSNEG